MTICENSFQSSNNNAKLFCLLMLFVMVGGVVMFSLAHAVERHGEEVTAICSAPVIHQVFRPTDKRFAKVCQLPDGRYGIMICGEDNGIVTCFIKEKMRKLEDVIRYLTNRGYQ